MEAKTYGNLEPLIEALRAENYSLEARALAADFLEGKLKLPMHRPRSKSSSDLVWPAKRVFELEQAGVPRKNAVADVAAELNCSKRSVQKSLAFCGLTRPAKRR